MTRDMNEELLLAILFFGFRRLDPSFADGTNKVFPSPNAGADDESWLLNIMLPLRDVLVPPSLLSSADNRPSLGCSCMD
jgi:hypothetical protein